MFVLKFLYYKTNTNHYFFAYKCATKIMRFSLNIWVLSLKKTVKHIDVEMAGMYNAMTKFKLHIFGLYVKRLQSSFAFLQAAPIGTRSHVLCETVHIYMGCI